MNQKFTYTITSRMSLASKDYKIARKTDGIGPRGGGMERNEMNDFDYWLHMYVVALYII